MMWYQLKLVQFNAWLKIVIISHKYLYLYA